MWTITGVGLQSGGREPTRVLRAKGLHPKGLHSWGPSLPALLLLHCQLEVAPRREGDSTGKPLQFFRDQDRNETHAPTLGQRHTEVSHVSITKNSHFTSEITEKEGTQGRREIRTLPTHSLTPRYLTNCSNPKYHFLKRRWESWESFYLLNLFKEIPFSKVSNVSTALT